jgi:hypothetical protein
MGSARERDLQRSARTPAGKAWADRALSGAAQGDPHDGACPRTHSGPLGRRGRPSPVAAPISRSHRITRSRKPSQARSILSHPKQRLGWGREGGFLSTTTSEVITTPRLFRVATVTSAPFWALKDVGITSSPAMRKAS